MANKVKPEQLNAAIAEQLKIYHETIINRINNLTLSAAKKLVKITKATAPRLTGSFRKNIDYKPNEKNRLGNQMYKWYVKDPDYRITHLLVNGHDDVPPDPFLKNALAEVLPEYEKAVEEAIKP